MPLVINTNVSSLNAQRQLVTSGQEMSTAMERLSSGKRINTAADDAAGLAISNRMTSQVRGLNQAIRNANDGISLIQTAEGALDESTNILQRIRELAIQSANGIYDDSNRATLNAEVLQLKEELNRIADTTTFNGQLLLDGSMDDVALQVGSQANQTINISIEPMNTDSLGGAKGGDVVGAQTNQADLLTALQTITDGTLVGANDENLTMKINGQSVGNLTAATTLQEALEIINSNISGVEAGATTELVAANDGTGIISGTDELTISLLNPDGSTNSFEIRDTGSMEELVEKINTTADGQLEASLNDEGRLVLASAIGAQITVTDNAAGVAAGITTGAATDVVQNAQLTFTITDKSVEHVDVSYTIANLGTGNLAETEVVQEIGIQARTDGDISAVPLTTLGQVFAEGDININGVDIKGFTTAGADSAASAAEIAAAINEKSDEHGVVATVSGATTAGKLVLNSVDGSEIKINLDGTNATLATTGLLETANSTAQSISIADVDISTQDGAQEAIEVVDRALDTVNDIRSNLGAASNRLDFTINNLMVVSENTAAARSRILDADFAAETAALSRAQVLQQASQAKLAQANAQPQQVLQLLQG